MEHKKFAPQKVTMDKIEKIIKIDPRSAEDIAKRIGLSPKTVRNLLSKLRKERRAYILKYISRKYNIAAIWAAGDHEDAKVPKNKRQVKGESVENRKNEFDYRKPVKCYGILGLP
jgi:DNA-binding Lrp family transcriptional regulator